MQNGFSFITESCNQIILLRLLFLFLFHFLVNGEKTRRYYRNPYLRSRYRGCIPLPWHVVHVNEPAPSQLMHWETSFSTPPSSTVTVPVPTQNLHFSGEELSTFMRLKIWNSHLAHCSSRILSSIWNCNWVTSFLFITIRYPDCEFAQISPLGDTL